MEYLKNRGIDEKIIKEFGIGLSLDNNDSLTKLLQVLYHINLLDYMIYFVIT